MSPRNPGKPKVLKGRDIPSLAKYIKSDACENVFLLLGAGVSTSAGIPDFRSPGTGLYSNLARLNLPNPEAVFEIKFFRKNPVPFYTLAHELFPGKFRPTITHAFIRLLAEKSRLHTCFTQNIDTLERRAGVPEDKIIEAHGSFASQRCIDCKRPFDDDKMKDHINNKKIAKCEKCGGYVKPDIVFFGEALPPKFISSVSSLHTADLLIVIGTSLTVQPFASLPSRVGASCPRVLINLDLVGDFGNRTEDLVLLGKCDDIVRELCKELGWEEDLVKLWDETDEAKNENQNEEDLPSTTTATSEKSTIPEKHDALQALEDELAKLQVEEGPPDSSELGTSVDPAKIKTETSEDLSNPPPSSSTSMSAVGSPGKPKSQGGKVKPIDSSTTPAAPDGKLQK